MYFFRLFFVDVKLYLVIYLLFESKSHIRVQTIHFYIFYLDYSTFEFKPSNYILLLTYPIHQAQIMDLGYFQFSFGCF